MTPMGVSARRPEGLLRGDAPDISPALYARPVTLAEAQAMVDWLRGRFPCARVTVIRGRHTRRLRGRAFAEDARIHWTIRLHPLGMNAGTVLHEFAHVAAWPVRGHGRRFKVTQRQVVETWEGRA